jgi:putative Ca2+/H+ antiporter (TMEM165/GDT1 family)
MFSQSTIKIPIIVLMVCTAIWLILRVGLLFRIYRPKQNANERQTFLAIFHCVPVQAFWDKSIKDAVCAIDDSKFFFGSVLAHLILDIAILALPAFQIGQLRLRRTQKIGIITMFMFGILYVAPPCNVIQRSLLTVIQVSASLPW